MEADAAYQRCLKSCELHSRSLAVGRTGACDLEIAHTCVTQSPDCAYVLRNLEIVHTYYAISRLPAQSRDSENAQRNLEIAQILRLRGKKYTPRLRLGVYLLQTSSDLGLG